MNGDRSSHGLLALHTTLLVFGGRYNYGHRGLKTCEKFQLLSNTWTDLPNMKKGRRDFNPCMFGGLVDICGGVRMEAFAPATNTLLPINIHMPETLTCCLYVHNNLLVVNSKNYIVKYAVGPRGQLFEQSRVDTPKVSKYQNSQPVVDRAQGLYFMVWVDKCVQVNMQTGVEGPRIA